MGELFQTVLVNPFLNALVWLYDVLPGHDLGVAIIVLTLAVRLLLFLPSLSSIKAQHQLQAIQPKVEAIRKKYAKNREEQGRKLLELYRENKVNPYSSCLPLLIQLPIIYGLFRAFLVIKNVDPGTGILAAGDIEHLYGWLQFKYETAVINTSFFGWFDLAATKNYVLAILAGAFAFMQAKMMQARKPAITSPGSKDEGIAAAMSKQTTYILPAITVFFGISFPAGVTLYWAVSTLFQVMQQWYFFKRHRIPTEAEEEKNV